MFFNINLGILYIYLKHQQWSVMWMGIKNHNNQIVVYNQAFEFDTRLMGENVNSSLLASYRSPF